MGFAPVEGAACTVTVRDVERAVRFYTKALGMRLRLSHSGPAADWAEVEGHGIRIVLVGRDRPAGAVGGAPPSAAALSIGFDVGALEDAMRVLRERGVEFAPEIVEHPEFRLAYFTDHDGTPLFLRERKR